MTKERIEYIKHRIAINDGELQQLCNLAIWAITEQEKQRQAQIDTGIHKPDMGTIATEAGGTGLK